MKIGIVIDSNGGLTRSQAEALGYYYIPMPICINGHDYLDGENLTYEEFLTLARDTKSVMLTAQATMYHIQQAWDKGLAENDHLIHIPLSSKLSKMHDTCLALSLTPEYLGKVSVVDTLDVIGTYLYTTQVAKTLADSNMSKDEIIQILKQRRGTGFGVLVPEDISYLKRGGRINAATAALANFLNFKPLILLKNGALHKLDKERGSKEKGLKKIISAMIKHLLKTFDPKTMFPLILHTNEIELAKEIASLVESAMPTSTIKFCNISSTVVCHTGPGAFAIAIIKKHPGIEMDESF